MGGAMKGTHVLKKIATVLLLGTSLVIAQDKPTPTPLAQPTIAGLKLQLAQKDLQIANLKLQLIQASADSAYCQAQNNLSVAQKAVQDAAPKPEIKSGSASDSR
jgi:hypothetical protein